MSGWVERLSKANIPPFFWRELFAAAERSYVRGPLTFSAVLNAWKNEASLIVADSVIALSNDEINDAPMLARVTEDSFVEKTLPNGEVELVLPYYVGFRFRGTARDEALAHFYDKGWYPQAMESKKKMIARYLRHEYAPFAEKRREEVAYA